MIYMIDKGILRKDSFQGIPFIQRIISVYVFFKEDIPA
jgi:hypothetical protein